MIAGNNLENDRGERLAVIGMILVYLLVEQVLHIPYLMWRKRVAARQAGGAHAAPA
jgi:hypothetical protein